MAAWHSLHTHPQIIPYTGDANSRYDIYGDHVNRALTPFDVISPNVSERGYDEQYVVDEYIRTNQEDKPPISVDDVTARQAIAQRKRAENAELCGRDFSEYADNEFVDALVYNVFPNFAPWGGQMPNVVYRFRPWPDQDACLMEVRVLAPGKPGEKKPTKPEMRLLDFDQPLMDAADEMSAPFANVFDQDIINLPQIHNGMKASANKRIELANYQEIRIRHFHQTIQKYFDRY